MRLVLHGGFGEKGRTCLAVESEGYRLLLDAGVKTSARGGREYYPAVTHDELAATDAMLVTHGHEDHVAALGWCLAGGFRGRIFMTPQTARETDEALAGYAEPAHRDRVRAAAIDALPLGAGALLLGPLRVSTGRSGHIAGGVWCVVADARVRFGFCGDVVPQSPVFRMDPLPPCEALALDASYGDDDVPPADRAAQVAGWVATQVAGCVLPTPRYGRSAELLAILPGTVALAPGMREALHAQLQERDWLLPQAEALGRRLDEAIDWNEGAPLPRAALLCHDGMGLAGPSRDVLAQARATGHPTLFTGHVPEGSPGARMLAEGAAHWVRLPTHPTLRENAAIATHTGARVVIGHSCDRDALLRLARHLPALRTDVATGDVIDI